MALLDMQNEFSQVMADLIERKLQYKKSGQRLNEKAIKILMNSGYGCLANAHFCYQDPRVVLYNLDFFVGHHNDVTLEGNITLSYIL